MTGPLPRVASAREGVDGPAADRIDGLIRRLSWDGLRLVEIFGRRQGLRGSEVDALVSIRLAEVDGEPLTPGDLASVLLLTTGAVTGLVDRLARSGHVRREPDGRDRRRIRLLTRQRGEEIASEVLRMLAVRTRGVVSEFTPEEIDAVERFLARTVVATTNRLWSLEA